MNQYGEHIPKAELWKTIAFLVQASFWYVFMRPFEELAYKIRKGKEDGNKS